ncbi:MAG: fibronectin type III domain-containing protein [Phycisphaerales bacterium]|nr:MAG: fibronectin type III domain-containing protein [Phycisphaerales bacterium]
MNAKRMFSITAAAILFLPGLAGAARPGRLVNTWLKLSPLPDSPASPRLGYEGACVWDGSRGLFIRYGGHNQGGGGAQYSEVWTFDPLTAKWTLKEPDTSPPGLCCAQQHIYDPVRRRYVRFPAFSGSHGWQWFREIYLNDSTIWVYDPDSNRWHNLCPVPAPAVSPLRCASWDSDAQVIVLFGGEGNREGTVVYDPHTNTWTRMRPPDEPPFRSAGNMVYDAANKLHILFGSQFTDDPHTWAYDLRKNRWRDLRPPQLPHTNENDAVLAYDSLNNVVVAVVKITEGKDEQAKHRLETWAYSTAKNAWMKMNPPREPDSTGNRSRVLVYAPELGLSILENRTRSRPGPPEQQIWTYCFDRPKTGPATLAPPKGLKVTTGRDNATLSWDPGSSKGASHLVLYRAIGAPPWLLDYRRIARLRSAQSEYHDKQLQRGTVYYYALRAATDERLSEPGLKVRTQPPFVEDAVISVLSRRRVHLAWTEPDGGDIIAYHLERAAVEVWTEDQLKRLKSRVRPLPEPSVGAIRRIGPFKRITAEPIAGRSFEDTVDLAAPVAIEGEALFSKHLYDEHLDPNGKPYAFGVFAYRIIAVNALGVESGPSPYFLTIPSAPRWLAAKEDGATCRLKWAANPEKNLKGYRVYRLDGRWDKDPISRMMDDPIADLQFADPSAGKGSRRYYVVAVDALGQEGMPSAPVWYNREWKRFYEPFTADWHQ